MFIRGCGRDYFMELLLRSFFQESFILDPWESRHIIKYKMHDLAISVAGIECATISSNEEHIDRRTRHVSLDFKGNSLRQLSDSLVQAKGMRTILLEPIFASKHEERSLSPIINSSTILNFKFLRTLDLSASGIEVVQNSVCALKRLRYLDLSHNDIRTVPNSITNLQSLLMLDVCWSKIEILPNGIGKLKHLRFLVVSYSSLKTLSNSVTMLKNLVTLNLSGNKFKELPTDITKLVSLRHLDIYGKHLTHMPCGVSQLTNLHTLSYFPLSGDTDNVPGHSAQLNELMPLNDLRGKLKISNLRHGEDAVLESKAANVKEKKHLQAIELAWDFKENIDIDETEVVVYEMSLEGLQPHPNLKELLLESYGGVKFSSWLSSLTNLESIELQNCWKFQHLLPLDQFHSLRKLQLIGLTSLEYISSSSEIDYFHSSSSSTTLLPSLETLWLWDLPNLKGWWRDNVVNAENHTTSSSFPRLSQLLIGGDCGKLISMPFTPHLQLLQLFNTKHWNPFQMETMNVARPLIQPLLPTKATNEASSSSNLSNTKNLSIYGNEDLQCLPDWLKGLPYLEMLQVSECSKFKDLSPCIQDLTLLRMLVIENCEVFDMSNDDPITWRSLRSLRFLQFNCLPKLSALPRGIQYATSLEYLYILDCKKLGKYSRVD
ncbi:LRR domain containing protein [Trema orientale]|uniref:LRR domain containing protein n=1 Tax=Trema orientale TaxID=63057 RepID=A0A2P5FFH3_TREOI|nr:LRR domain containing protein [Trema orientale]